MSESEADKRRNKLGYQRISVACAHCRRRKIRCVMADGDPHNRCQNCIRLNKECIFHPVEQPGGIDAATTPTSSSFHSPRDLAAGQSFDPRSSTFSRLAPLPSNAPSELASFGYDSPSHGASQANTFEFRAPQYPETRWSGNPDMGSSLHSSMGEPESQGLYFGQSNDAFGALSTSQRPLSPESRSYSFSGGAHDEGQWQMLQHQGRSMSYGNFEAQSAFGQQQNHPSGGMQPVHHNTFPIDTQGATSIRGNPGPHSAPIVGSQHSFHHAGGQYMYQTDASHDQQHGNWYHQGQQGYGDFDSGHAGGEELQGQRKQR